MEAAAAIAELDLDASNKVQRKKNVQKLNELFGKKAELDLPALWTSLHPALFRRLRDEAERTREAAAEAVATFYDAVPASEYRAQYLFPVLRSRLAADGGVAEAEPSEEVRAAYVKLVEKVLRESSTDEVRPYLDDVFAVLSACLTDKFVDVKLSAAACVEVLASKEDSALHLGATGLVDPLVRNLPHQQRRVRASSVRSLGLVLAHCDGDAFRSCVPSLAQRLFDPVAEVRMATAVAVASLSTDWTYRHDNFPFLVPLLITGLEDEVPDVAEEVRAKWEAVGANWISEEAARDKRIKDRIDFPEADPSHYPEGVPRRPGLGCRLLTSRQFFRLKEAVARDLADWLAETRTKASQLLCQLVLHLEADLVGHAEAVLNIFNLAVADAESAVADNACRAASWFGHFVPARSWLPLVLRRLEEKTATRDLRVLSCIVGGSESASLRPHLDDLAFFLAQDKIAHVREDEYLFRLICCCSNLLSTCGEGCRDVEPALFGVAVAARALAQNPAVVDQADGLLSDLETTLGHADRSDLYRHHMGPILRRYSSSCTEWGPHSHEVHIFATLVREGGSAAGSFSELLAGIFQSVLTRRDAAPELQLKVLMVLSNQMLSNKDSNNNLEGYCFKILSEVIMPHLKWKAGKKSQAVRTAASAALWSMLKSGSLSQKETTAALPTLLPVMTKLAEDSSEKIRSFTAKSLKLVLVSCGPDNVPKEATKSITEVMLRRLEDASDDVRLLAMDVLSECCFDADSDLAEDVVSTLLTHMDDEKPTVRRAALDALLAGKKAEDGKVLSRVVDKADLSKHRHREEVDALSKHLQRALTT